MFSWFDFSATGEGTDPGSSSIANSSGCDGNLNGCKENKKPDNIPQLEVDSAKSSIPKSKSNRVTEDSTSDSDSNLSDVVDSLKKDFKHPVMPRTATTARLSIDTTRKAPYSEHYHGHKQPILTAAASVPRPELSGDGEVDKLRAAAYRKSVKRASIEEPAILVGWQVCTFHEV